MLQYILQIAATVLSLLIKCCGTILIIGHLPVVQHMLNRFSVDTFTNRWRCPVLGVPRSTHGRRPADHPCCNLTKILIKKKDGGACSKADFALVQRSFIMARLGLAREAGGSAQPVQIRDSHLVNGRVEVTVWDNPFEEFVLRAVGELESEETQKLCCIYVRRLLLFLLW